MQEGKNKFIEKLKQAMKKIRLKNKIKPILIVLIAILIFASCIIAIAIVPNIGKTIKPTGNKYLEYEIKDKIEEGKYNILIKVKSEDGIDYIKCPNGNILYANGETIVGIDYQILEEVKYDFTIKPKNKDEVVETIYQEVKKIEGKYELVNGVYLNKPDLTGFDSRYTRYLEPDKEGDMVPGNWTSTEPNENWYDYKSSEWANICYEYNGASTYYVWIPRYCFKLDQENERSDVKFVDTSNNYKDENGNIITWAELEEQGYQIPEAFSFNDTRIPGYWAMKYTAGDITTPSTINYDMSVFYGEITIKNITLNTSITSSNPIVKYTVALNGKIIKTIENSEEVANINSQVIELSDMIKGENVVNVTGLNEKGEIVGTMTKLYSPAAVNEPDLSGFNPETTFYVTYDADGNEYSTTPITEEKPDDWYEYGESRWANIVTRNNDLETYYTWIPRYEFMLDQTNERSMVKFISGTSTQTTTGYQIPEAFWFDKNGDGAQTDDEQLTGYWAMKYTAGTEAELRFNTEVTATSSSIKTKGITGTAKADGQVYKYYINGQYKGENTDATASFEYTGLDSNTKYTILVEIRNSSTNEYLGTIVKQISTIDANKPELTGFNADCTYYVLYDDEGNETIGDKIKNDGSNMPSNWYNYSESRWANIVVEANGMKTYYTWIPRYEFKITSSQQAQPAIGRTEVRFIDGTSTEVDTGYQIPEAFWFDKNGDGSQSDDEQLTGYWAMKYTAGE